MADIHQPHDRLFRGVFADPKEAAGLLQATLPPDVRDSFDWTTLALRSGTFIDEGTSRKPVRLAFSGGSNRKQTAGIHVRPARTPVIA